jgi:hypothetical protein
LTRSDMHCSKVFQQMHAGLGSSTC